MSKISELSDGGSLVSSDYLIAVRSGGNVKVRMDSINVDQIDLGDNEFIRLGNSQDLTMVHNASNSIINQAGIGDLLIQKAGATKLTINASGIDVTGSVTATGIVGASDGTNGEMQFGLGTALTTGAGTYDSSVRWNGSSGNLLFSQGAVERMRITSTGYVEMAGAADVRLTLGSQGTAGNNDANWIRGNGTSLSYNAASANHIWETGGSEKARIDASGNVGIGTNDPATYGGLALQQSSNTSSKGLAIVDSTAAQSVKLWVDGTNSYLSSGNTGADPLVLNLGGGNVGIGTSSAAFSAGSGLRIERAATATLRLQDTGSHGFEIRAAAGAAEFFSANSKPFTFSSGTSELMRIDSNGNVGIGTSNGAFQLEIGDGTDALETVNIVSTDAGSSRLFFSDDSSNGQGRLTYDHSDNHLEIYTADTEAMRIDASGNLLVNRTSVFTTAKMEIQSDAGDASTLALNSIDTDGSVLEIYKAGNTVGSIGAKGGDLAIYSTTAGHEGLLLGNGAIVPTDNAGATTDNACNLGGATGRFTNLYLAGGVYLGGTGAANKLDDYEEGTWTPVLTKATTAPSVTYSSQIGTYTKVGRMIYVSGLLSWTAISGGTGDFRVAGLPFTILSSNSAYPQLVCLDHNGVLFGANDTTFGGYGVTNGTTIVLLASRNNATPSSAISGLATSGFMYFNLTYQAA